MIKRIRNKLGKTGTVIAVLIVIAMLGVGAAVAAIFLRAEVSGTVNSGAAVAFEWAVTTDGGATYGDGALSPLYVTADGDGTYTMASLGSVGLTCTIEVVNGTLEVNMSGGWLPSEGCGIGKSGDPSTVYLYNPSSVDVAVIAWDFGTSDLSLKGDGGSVQIHQTSGGIGDLWTPETLPAFAAAGSAQAAPSLLFFVDSAAAFDTAFDLGGTAVIGETSR